MSKAKFLGVSWQSLTLLGATLIGLIGIHAFPQGLAEPEQLTLKMVREALPPAFVGLILCAILAATTNVMAAQMLVVASNVSEDLYKRLKNPYASPQKLLWVSRASILGIALVSFLIAFFKVSSIYELVFFSWSGLGASFGPLLLLSLYGKKINRQGALAGILIGGGSVIIGAYLEKTFSWSLPAIIPAYLLGIFSILFVSKLYAEKVES